MLPYLRPSQFALLPRAANAASSVVRSGSAVYPRTAQLARFYATQNDLGRGSGTGPSVPKRRNVTVLSDDGRYQWGELSGKEKAARATQQSVNFVVVLVGAVLTGGVFTLLYLEVLSPNSSTWQFEKAVGRIKDSPRCTNVLGDPRKIKAYGNSTWSRWARNRPIATSIEKDGLGRDHLRMNFHVEGPLNSGVVYVHMLKPHDKNEWEYLLLALDVKGYTRILLEQRSPKAEPGKPMKILGIQWR